MSSWTPAQIPDLAGKRAVVTGANSGLGYHTALQLAAHGAQVVMACRDQGRGAEAVARVKAAVPRAQVELMTLDLADLGSIKQFATALGSKSKALHILVNNAGVMHIPESRTADGFEMQFGTNHLGHFALTGRLMPLLLAQPAARVVTVSSIMARVGVVDFGNLNAELGYEQHRQYGLAKLSNQLFMLELDRRARAAGTSLISAAAHPGYAATNLQSRGPEMSGNRLGGLAMKLGNALVAQSDAQGAWPSLYAATMPAVEGGDYYGPSGLGQLRGHPRSIEPVASARDLGVAGKLWEESERLTGVAYDFGAKPVASSH